MIWLVILRSATALSLAATALQLYDLATREVKPNRIYSTQEAARFLGMDRRAVVQLARKNELHGRLVDGNYRIPGQSILEFLKK